MEHLNKHMREVHQQKDHQQDENGRYVCEHPDGGAS